MAKLEIEEITGTKVNETEIGDVFRWEGDYYMHLSIQSDDENSIVAVDLSDGTTMDMENDTEVDVVKARLQVKVED